MVKKGACDGWDMSDAGNPELMDDITEDLWWVAFVGEAFENYLEIQYLVNFGPGSPIPHC